MAHTITAFNVFTAGTKIKSADVNTNFANFRGDLVPVDASLGSAADASYDLGTPEHRWKGLYSSGGIMVGITTVSAAYSTTSNDFIILATASAGAMSISLTSAVTAGKGRVFEITKINTNTNAITLDPTGSENLMTSEGATTTTTLNTYNETVRLISDGTNYWVRRTIPSQWTTFTPTGAWTTNTTYTGQWQRIGNNMRIQIKVALSGAPDNLTFTVNMPTGYTIDTTKLLSTQTSQTRIGWGGAHDATAGDFPLDICYSSTSALRVVYYLVSIVTDNDISNAVSKTGPMSWASGDFMYFECTVPIVGWNS